MHRLVVLLVAAASAAALGACSGGGSALNFGGSAPTSVIITVVGPSNIARVIPGGSLPLSAIAVTGSQNGVNSNNGFIWSAALTTGGQYVADTLGTMKPCASVQMTKAGVTTPYTADFGIYIAIDPTNESNIIFLPPTILPPPAGATLTTNYPYCVTVSAQAIKFNSGGTTTPFGTPGTIVVAVPDPQNPLQ
jgi:hypothetical protein